MIKNQINQNILQQVLESATNAGAKGQAQYFTPHEWGTVLSLPLPKMRPVIVDLTCGDGQLLASAGSKAGGRQGPAPELLGCDIGLPSPPRSGRGQGEVSIIQADLTKLYALIRAVKFKADLFVLNPPWDMHWHRDRLKELAFSEVPAVREAFAARPASGGRQTIDSTMATLCIALDRCSRAGEGFLIANEATLQRLLFAPDAPFRALTTHIWAHLVINGNICLSASPRLRGEESDFKTGVIYFAPAHGGGPRRGAELTFSSLEEAQAACETLALDRLMFRKGEEAADYNRTTLTQTWWRAIIEEWSLRTATATASQYNIWLGDNGCIQTNLSLFDQHSGRVDKDQATRLFALNGKRPMQLVMLRHERKELEHLAFDCDAIYRVDPKLQLAISDAVAEYHRERAPLYPLSKIQRIGFLDEQEDILCEAHATLDGSEAYTTGKRYAIRSLTLRVNRKGTKVNNIGLLDMVEWDGQELAFYIKDNTGVERLFMKEGLRGENVRVSLPGEDDKDEDEETPSIPIDFTLQELVAHFNIPEVPDLASVNPEKYQANLELLEEIERLVCQ